MRSLRIPGLPSPGALSFGALAVCVASGAIVMTGYEIARPLASILGFETTRPWGWFFRALHAWSADLFVVALAVHTVESVARRDDRTTPWRTWSILALSLPISLYLRIGGAMLTGDADSRGVAAVMSGLARIVPFVGPWTSDLLLGGAPRSLTVVLAHHAVTATLVVALITFFHTRRVTPEANAIGAALGLAGLISLVHRPALGPFETTSALHGPWPLAGLRWLLRFSPAWISGVALPIAAFVVFATLPTMKPSPALASRRALAIVGAAYLILTAVAWVA